MVGGLVDNEKTVERIQLEEDACKSFQGKEGKMIYQQGGIYHIFNRGCDRRKIFMGDDNYRFFLRKVRLLKDKYGIDVIAYCLMPNHFHLLVKQNSDSPISKWIQKVLSGYVQAFNKQNDRKGTLFESSTKPRLINKDEYLNNIIHYIHLNPVKASLVENPEEWQYSSYKYWISENESSFVSLKLRKEIFTSKQNYLNSFNEYFESKSWINDEL